MSPRVKALRELFDRPGLVMLPCCFDALSARLIERAGFSATFMSGFGVAAARFGLPDTGLVSYGEMVEQGRDICAAVSIPVIGDADTGYGNPLNVKRTVRGYAAAGFAGVMAEDQVASKRCGHTEGKQVVDRAEALNRLRAALDARDETDGGEGGGPIIIARTDARVTDGLDEAIWRAQAFADMGADIVFVEAPQSEDELARVRARVPGVLMANMVDGGATPVLSPRRLEALGYKAAAYSLTLLSAATGAMERALDQLQQGKPVADGADFARMREVAGFTAYAAAAAAYAEDDTDRILEKRGLRPAVESGTDTTPEVKSTGEKSVLEVGKWVVGAMVAVIGLFALYLASRADEPVMHWVGIIMFIAAVLFEFLLIKQHYDTKSKAGG